mgnify:CR=1 FL=1
MSDEPQETDLFRLAFAPGVFQCPTCGFNLIKTAINAQTGAMGTRESDRMSEDCQNDGTMMRLVTYREMCHDLDKLLGKQAAKLDALRRVLTRETLAEVLYRIDPRIVPSRDRFLQQADAILALPEVAAIVGEEPGTP